MKKSWKSMAYPMDHKSPQVDGPLMANEVHRLQKETKNLYQRQNGNAHCWHWPDPDYAPTVLINSNNTYKQFQFGTGSGEPLTLPWYMQENFDSLIILISVACSRSDIGFYVYPYSSTLVDAVAATDGDPMEYNTGWAAPSGKWSEEIDYNLNPLETLFTPTLPASRTFELSFYIKQQDLTSSVINVPSYPITRVKIYSLHVYDFKK